MKNKFLAMGLALAMAMGPVASSLDQSSTSYAASQQEIIDMLDTTSLERQIEAARLLMVKMPQTFKNERKQKLERLIKESEALIAEANAMKAELAANSNLNIRIKNIIRSNLDNRNEKFKVNINAYTTNKQIQDWFLETAKEDWYFFYSMYERANVSTKYNPKKAKGDDVYIDSVNFTITYRESPAVEKEVEAFADQWVAANIQATDLQYEKVKKIHDFIVTQNQYNRGDSNDKSAGYSIYHPASILYGNGGVCNAYATLFDKLATKAGLEVRYATGYSKKTGEPHIWNMVKISENWYNIDATWDDPTISFPEGDVVNLNEFVIYDYFLKSDEEILKSRTIDEDPNKPLAPFSLDMGLKNPTIQKIGDQYMVVK